MELKHLQGFLGCTNWVRGYLPQQYGFWVKILGAWLKPGAKFPLDEKGLQAVKAIKKMVKDHISLAAMDEAAAMAGTRPLDQVADASGIAWGQTIVQMTTDLSRFRVLAVCSGGLTPAQQSWSPLTCEAYAQLMVKRFQRRTLGSMRSLCWTDHANVTKLQAGAKIVTNNLRWTSEIQADGSDIRSLGGRACRLGDGYSRNPPDRDRLIEQRTKDLEGLCGQVRGFDLEAFPGEYESDGLQVSCLADDALPVMVMARDELSAQARRAVRVLYVAGYMSENRRVAESGAAWRTIQQMMPDARVHMALCLGPIGDDLGIAAFCEGTRPRMNLAACSKQFRRDLLTGVATGLRQWSCTSPISYWVEAKGPAGYGEAPKPPPPDRSPGAGKPGPSSAPPEPSSRDRPSSRPEDYPWKEKARGESPFRPHPMDPEGYHWEASGRRERPAWESGARHGRDEEYCPPPPPARDPTPPAPAEPPPRWPWYQEFSV